MSLEEYVIYNYDMFIFDIDGHPGEDFPCCVCKYNEKDMDEEPCKFCSYNDDAVDCYYCALCGELKEGHVLLDSNVVAEGTQAQIGGVCDKCFEILKNELKKID